MSESNKRQSKRSDEEWISLIQECHTSGMTDKVWCEEHHIQPSMFYYHLKRLRAKACSLPDNPKVISQLEHHEIVKVDLRNMELQSHAIEPVEPPYQPFVEPIETRQQPDGFRSETCAAPAIHVSVGRYTIEILNSAERDTILNTLSVLQQLC